MSYLVAAQEAPSAVASCPTNVSSLMQMAHASAAAPTTTAQTAAANGVSTALAASPGTHGRACRLSALERRFAQVLRERKRMCVTNPAGTEAADVSALPSAGPGLLK